MTTDPDCLFCKIATGDVPADVVRRTEATVAFRDINPQAPTHVLVIPTEHHRDAAALAAADPRTMVALVDEAAAVAEAEGLADGYRLVFNTGPAANQVVPHAHLHILGGRSFGWPPG